MLNTTQLSLLRTLFTDAREDLHANLLILSEQLELSIIEVEHHLEVLERFGLVDAERVRLTMRGLVLATSLPAVERRALRSNVAA